jgi:hypothetical protein
MSNVNFSDLYANQILPNDTNLPTSKGSIMSKMKIVERVFLWLLVLTSLTLVIVSMAYDMHETNTVTLEGNVAVGLDGSVEAPAVKASIFTDDLSAVLVRNARGTLQNATSSITNFTASDGEVSAKKFTDGILSIQNGEITSENTTITGSSLSSNTISATSNLSVGGSFTLPSNAASGRILSCIDTSGNSQWIDLSSGDISSSGSAVVGALMISRHIDGNIIGSHTETNPGGVIPKITGSTPTLFGVEDFQSHTFTNRQGVTYREFAQITEETLPSTYGVLRMNNLFSSDGTTKPTVTASLLQRVGRDLLSETWASTPMVLPSYLKQIEAPLTSTGNIDLLDTESFAVSLPLKTLESIGDSFECEGSGIIDDSNTSTNGTLTISFTFSGATVQISTTITQQNTNTLIWKANVSGTLVNATDVDNILLKTSFTIGERNTSDIPQTANITLNSKSTSIPVSTLETNETIMFFHTNILTVGTDNITQQMVKLKYIPVGSISII